MTSNERAARYPRWILRLSIGNEDAENILADIEQALQ